MPFAVEDATSQKSSEGPVVLEAGSW